MNLTETLVVLDLDGTFRTDKQMPRPEAVRAVEEFQSRGGIVEILTGGPLAHVPDALPVTVYAESGGVMRDTCGQEKVLRQDAQQAIARFRHALGITVSDGLMRLAGLGEVIVEGPRHTGVTMLAGNPPHYPALQACVSVEEVKSRAESVVRDYGLPLFVERGAEERYQWVDVMGTCKAETLRRRMPCFRRVYYLGDGRNDLAPMQLEGVVPVGFANSIPEIRRLAKRQGVFIPRISWESGVCTFFAQTFGVDG